MYVYMYNYTCISWGGKGGGDLYRDIASCKVELTIPASKLCPLLGISNTPEWIL